MTLTKTKNGIEIPLNADEIAEFETMEADHLARVEAYQSVAYKDKRRAAYPSCNDLIVALWERVIEDRPEASDVLEGLRQQVKQDFPKP